MRVWKWSLFFAMSSGKDSSLGEWRLWLFQVAAFLCQPNCLAFGKEPHLSRTFSWKYSPAYVSLYSNILNCLFCAYMIYIYICMMYIQWWIWRLRGRESPFSGQPQIHENTAHYLQLRYCQVSDKFVEIWTETSNITYLTYLHTSYIIIYRIRVEKAPGKRSKLDQWNLTCIFVCCIPARIASC